MGLSEQQLRVFGEKLKILQKNTIIVPTGVKKKRLKYPGAPPAKPAVRQDMEVLLFIPMSDTADWLPVCEAQFSQALYDQALNLCILNGFDKDFVKVVIKLENQLSPSVENYAQIKDGEFVLIDTSESNQRDECFQVNIKCKFYDKRSTYRVSMFHLNDTSVGFNFYGDRIDAVRIFKTNEIIEYVEKYQNISDLQSISFYDLFAENEGLMGSSKLMVQPIFQKLSLKLDVKEPFMNLDDPIRYDELDPNTNYTITLGDYNSLTFVTQLKALGDGTALRVTWNEETRRSRIEQGWANGIMSIPLPQGESPYRFVPAKSRFS